MAPNKEVKFLWAQITSLTNDLEEFIDFVDTLTMGQVTEVEMSQLKRKLKQIDSYNKEYRDISIKLTCHNDPIDPNDYREFCNNFISSTAKADQIIEKFESSVSSMSKQKVGISETPRISSIRVPQVNLPPFDGQYRNWSSFKDTFCSSVHNNSNIDSDAERFLQLKSVLRGQALEIVENIPTSNSGYKTAWDLLNKRYDNKKLLIQDHVRSIVEYPVITKENHYHLRQLLNNINKNIRALENLDRPVSDDSDFVTYIIISKFDNQTKRHFSEYTKSHTQPVTIQDITNFLENRCELLEDIEGHKTNNFPSNKIESKTTNQKSITNLATSSSQICFYCKDNHNIYKCQSFLDLNQKSRFAFVKNKNLCTNCLKRHSVLDCKSTFRCRECKRKHNSLLHETKQQESVSNTTNQTNSGVSNTNQTNSGGDLMISDASYSNQNTLVNHTSSSQILLSTAIINVFDSKGNMRPCRAILDSGSQSNLITESFFQSLNLPMSSIDYTVYGINSNTSNISNAANIKISSISSQFETNISCLILPNITGNIPNTSFNKANLNIPTNVKLADPDFNMSNPIDLLIGASLFWNLLLIGRISLGKNNPILQKTKLGWIVCGPFLIPSNNKAKILMVTAVKSSTSLDKLLTRFWQVDEPQLPLSLMTEEEQYCEQHFKKNHRRDPESGRFIVSIPLKESLSNLGNSREIALRRFHYLERKLNKNPSMKEQYVNFMLEYESLGHMLKVNEENDSNINQQLPIVYIPHHAVFKESSLSTKLRVVFDASAKTDSGISLNDIQMVGPVVQDELFSILLRFRQHSFVITADVNKMYRQIAIDPSQRCLQRIFWRQNPTDKLESFELNTVTYGTSSAPYLATKCLQQLAINYADEFPVASNVIKNDMYVDDLLTGCDSIEELREIRDTVIHILSSAQFPLRKFLSNAAELLNDLDSNQELYVLNLGENENNKTLGILWNAFSDSIQYRIKDFSSADNKSTKRLILSTISSLYDPYGLLSPIIISAKLLIQALWQEQLSWDEKVPHQFQEIWFKFCKDLNVLNQLRIPRHVILHNSVNIELHAFCDASEKAYGACIYLKSQDLFGGVVINLLCSKSRVAPLRKVTLPRLELCGALLAAQLVKKVINSLKLSIPRTFYWCDSTITLAWLKNHPSKWKTFVANRVAEIQVLSNSNDWYHVKSNQNPADLISRGVNPKELLDCQLWWHGPGFLSDSINICPTIQDIDLTNCPELRLNQSLKLTTQSNVNCFITASTNNESDWPFEFSIFDRFSSYMKFIRIVAYCLRFKYNCLKSQQKDNKTIGPLTVSEVQLAETRLIRLSQRESFAEELKLIHQKGFVDSKSKISSLNPFLDEDEIIRVGGRLSYSHFNYSKKHPILLASQHSLTKLIVRSEHIRLMHCGPQTLLASVRERFWPISGRNLVRSVVRNCIKCFKINPPIQNCPIMGNLPPYRTKSFSVFNETGVDYAGPFLIKDRKLRGGKLIKAYVALFICLSTKAVHLELVTNLTSEAFIATFRRFISRRGKPHSVYSDNGTNFSGANNEMKKLALFLKNNDNKIQISNYCTNERINWNFIPSHSPHFGGIWEAGIKSMKYHLKRVIGNANLNFEEFYTVLVQAEAILNSRPLSPLSSSPEDCNPLTPGHFLIGKPLTALPDQNLISINASRLSKFQRLQQLTQHIWCRWSKEYISELQVRQKWKMNGSAMVKLGALVLVKDENLPPLRWQLGRIKQLHMGKDGVTRVVSLKTSTSNFKRAVNKIVILPIDT